MTLASIIVTYHPDFEQVNRNIASFADDVDCLMIWDNSEPAVDWRQTKQLFPHLRILHSGSNEGLPIAYNNALLMATVENCTHLMTMDQDSTFENFNEYRRQLETINDPSIGIFTCPINNDARLNGYRSTTVCQSGSIYSLAMLQHIGDFREDLFIGMVDAEICLRAMGNGYRIYQASGCNLVHHVGSEREVKIFGHPVAVSDYSPLRHYYDSRNRILLWHEFPDDFTLGNKIKHLRSRMKLATKIALFEQDKLVKIKAILTGTWYGLRNKAKAYQH